MSTIRKLIETKVKESKGSFFYTSTILITSGAQEFLKLVSYHCPCVDKSNLSMKCQSWNSKNLYWEHLIGSSVCSKPLNYFYGLSFAIAPAVALFFLGIAVQPKFWKSITGCFKRSDRQPKKWQYFLIRLIEIIGFSLISPISWLCISLIDGDHLSCAFTPLAYDIGGSGSTYKNCTEVTSITQSNLTYSDLYHKNKAYFQLIGWVSTALTFLVGFFFYCFKQSRKSLSYYQEKFHSVFKEIEAEVLDTQIAAKALESANNNVKMFLEESRGKNLWDMIAFDPGLQRQQSNKCEIMAPLHVWAKQMEDDNETTRTDVTS